MPWATLGWLLVVAPPLNAQLTIQVSSSTQVVIPDDNPSGAFSSVQVSVPWVSIGTVHVSLRVESVLVNTPMFNGDLYAYLSHTDSANNSGIAVLLNRVGREGDSPFGYDDNGFNVTFNDSAASGDVHGYRSVLYGNPNAPIPSPGLLTGTWSPDGRETDPDSTVSWDGRTAMLSGFAGLDPNGVWTLFLADVSSGGQAQLVSWDLTVISAVPEPSWSAIAGAVALLGWGCLRRRAG